MRQDLVETLGTFFRFCSDRTAMWVLFKQENPGEEDGPWQPKCHRSTGFLLCPTLSCVYLCFATNRNIRLPGGEEKDELL